MRCPISPFLITNRFTVVHSEFEREQVALLEALPCIVGPSRGLENNNERGKEGSWSQKRYFFPPDRLTIGFHSPSPPSSSLRFSRDRTTGTRSNIYIAEL